MFFLAWSSLDVVECSSYETFCLDFLDTAWLHKSVLLLTSLTWSAYGASRPLKVCSRMPYLLCAASCSLCPFPCLGKGLHPLCPSSDQSSAAEPAPHLPAAWAPTHPSFLSAPGSCPGWHSCPGLLQQGWSHVQVEGWVSGLCLGKESFCFIRILSLEGLSGYMGPFLLLSLLGISVLFLNIPKYDRLSIGTKLYLFIILDSLGISLICLIPSRY